MKVVIIGGGTAGLATATKLRRLDENAEIVILEKSAEFAVSTQKPSFSKLYFRISHKSSSSSTTNIRISLIPIYYV